MFKLVSIDKLSRKTAIATISDGLQLFKLTVRKNEEWHIYASHPSELPLFDDLSWIHDLDPQEVFDEINSLLTREKVALAWNLSFFINADVIPAKINDFIVDTVKLNPKNEKNRLIYKEIPTNVLAASFLWSVIARRFGNSTAASVAFSRCNASTLYKVIRYNIDGIGDSIRTYMESRKITEDNISQTNLKNYKFYGCVIRIFRGNMQRCKICGRWCEKTFCCRKCYGASISN